MKRALAFVLTLVMLLSFAPAALANTTSSASSTLTEADQRAIDGVCEQRTWDSVYFLSRTIGTRVGGMASEYKAVNWMLDEFKELGLETEKHEFTLTGGNVNRNLGFITLHNAESFHGQGTFHHSFFDTVAGVNRGRTGGPFMPFHGGCSERPWEVGAAANGAMGVTVTGKSYSLAIFRPVFPPVLTAPKLNRYVQCLKMRPECTAKNPVI